MEQGQSVPSVRAKLQGLPCSQGTQDVAEISFLLGQQLLLTCQAVLFLAFLVMFTGLSPPLSKTCASMARKKRKLEYNNDYKCHEETNKFLAEVTS